MAGNRDDFLRVAGAAAIGARLRKLSDRIDQDAARLYAQAGVRFEQRWFGLINQLVIHGPMSVGGIAKNLGITHVSVSQARASLEKAGLIDSRADPKDGRRRELYLTQKGNRLVRRMQPIWAALSETAIEIEREAGGVIDALDRLDDVLDHESLFDRASRQI